jgi:hypothetical protein
MTLLAVLGTAGCASLGTAVGPAGTPADSQAVVARASAPAPELPSSEPVVSYWDAGIYLARIKPFVLLAVWDDGTVLKLIERRFDRGEIQGKYQVGRLARSEVAKLLEAIRASGFFEPTVPYGSLVYVDGPARCVWARDGRRRGMLTYHGGDDRDELNGIGPNALPSRAQVEAFLKTWHAVLRAIDDLSPSDVGPYEGSINLRYPQNPALESEEKAEEE